MATPDKRAVAEAAVTQADRQAVLADASAARTWPISIHLTPFAPGCARMAIDNAKRWRTFYGRTPAQVVRATLGRIALAPGAAKVTIENGDPQIVAVPADDLAPHLSSEPGAPVPFAVFWEGLTAERLTAELADLVRAGWTPPALAEARP